MNVARYDRRMDTYPVGSLNQVILKGYYYDFVLRNQAEILCRCVINGTEKRSEALLCLVSNGTRDQGAPRSDRGLSVDP